jgi:RimJ/RimL family protein N-acetyltransferase
VRIATVPLVDARVRLEPLDEGLREPLRAAIDGDFDSWSIMVTNGFGDAFDAWFDQRVAHMASGGGPAWAVRRVADGRIVGTSSLHDPVPAHRRVELGSTVYAPEARGTAVNPACKRLLLGHAFNSGAIRVEIITDALNLRSQAAIARLGAVREATLRRHKITWTGRVRDTVMFAITDEDWPGVRDRLDARLAAFD